MIAEKLFSGKCGVKNSRNEKTHLTIIMVRNFFLSITFFLRTGKRWIFYDEAFRKFHLLRNATDMTLSQDNLKLGLRPLMALITTKPFIFWQNDQPRK